MNTSPHMIDVTAVVAAAAAAAAANDDDDDDGHDDGELTTTNSMTYRLPHCDYDKHRRLLMFSPCHRWRCATV